MPALLGVLVGVVVVLGRGPPGGVLVGVVVALAVTPALTGVASCSSRLGAGVLASMATRGTRGPLGLLVTELGILDGVVDAALKGLRVSKFLPVDVFEDVTRGKAGTDMGLLSGSISPVEECNPAGVA